MLVPIEWLNDYIEIKEEIDTFASKMIMSGSNIETCQPVMEEAPGVVVGQILKIEKHIDADKLVVCSIDIGQDEPVQIVTGAKNVFEGAFVPVATDGSRIPGSIHGQPKGEGGIEIKKGKLRGVDSFGMICSASELGFDDKVIPISHREGIWILPEGVKPGQEIIKALDLGSDSVDFEITPNRADCLSMIGMARETAATFGGEIKYPETGIKKVTRDISEFIKVAVMDSQLCKRYVARVVTDIKIQESPWWIQKRLMTAGMRPINNIVDITNFVLLEYGQPIHAFDINHVEGKEITVRIAKDGEKITTLDSIERNLKNDMLMIGDANKSVAIAGVMGGENSEITEQTKTILIESANFDADSVRATSKKLGLRTEASSRYEKGIDPNLCGVAADRVCHLIELIGAGKVVEGAIDVYPKQIKSPTIEVRIDRVNSILGTEISKEKMIGIFQSLEMKCEEKGDIILVTPPTARLDLNTEIDYVEEVARIYGYDNLPTTIPKGKERAIKEKDRALVDKARDVMCALGANEIQTYSFVSPRDVDKIRIDEDSWERDFVVIKNPLGEDNSVMRTVLTPALLEVLGRNYSRNVDYVRAFEIGTTFAKNMVNEALLPDESMGLTLGIYGQKQDFFTLKGMITELLENLGINEPEFFPESEYGVYHPGRCARIVHKEEELGIMGEIHPEVAKTYGIDAKVYVAEFFFDAIDRNAKREVYYQQLPKYPATTRDIALLVDENVLAGDIQKTIKVTGGRLLEKVELFDVYRGQQIEEKKKSLAYTLTYRDKNKTLTDEETQKVHNQILEILEKEFKAILREM